MPDVSSGIAVEGDDDARHHAGIGADGVLPAHFIRLGRPGGAGVTERAFRLEFEGIEAAAVENLEADQMQVNGVRVVGEVEELPYLRSVEDGLFGDGRVPRGVVEQHAHRALHVVHALVEGETASFNGTRFGEALDGMQRGRDDNGRGL